MWALVSSLAIFVASLGLLAWFDRDAAGEQFADRRAVDRHSQHSLRDLGERRQPLADPALHVPHAALRADLLELHQGSLQGILRLPAAAGIRPGRRLPGAGPLPLLRLLGSLPGAHVLPDRHLGPRPPHLRRRQVLPLHHGRLRPDAGGDHLHLQQDPDLQLSGDSGDARQRPVDLPRRRADAALPRLLLRLRHQGAALPAAHLAARRARGSAHRRLRHAGRRHAEDGHLRYPALLPAALPQRRARLRPLDRRARHHRHHLRRAGRAGAAQS